MQGKIKHWNTERAFGFLVRDDGGGDLFVHLNSVEDDVEELNVGDRVSFELGKNRKDDRPQAVNVRLIRETPPQPAKPARYGS